MARIEKYALRLDNSICDVVTLLSPNNILKCDQKTPAEKDRIEKFYPGRTGVLMAHINPNDISGRKCFVYFDHEKDSDSPSELDMKIANFEMDPKSFHDQLVNHNIRDKIYTVELSNLIYIFPYKFKREKIVTDGETHALMKNVAKSPFSKSLKSHLSQYDWATKEQTEIPDMATCGKVSKNWHQNDLYPLEVEFPDKTKIRARSEDLMFFHELDE